MCGIIGYAGKRRAADIIFCGLKQLEYRGYDSVGAATLSDGKIRFAKRRGRVVSIKENIDSLAGNIGIGHTRWATHGAPSDANAHPHIFGKFAVVHNGIIENFAELKETYFKGVDFISETDSEIIVRLLDKFYSGDILAALKRVADMLAGSYALMVLCEDFHGIAVAKYKSPAILGYGKDGFFCASDAPALAGNCGEISVLEDGDMALITRDGISVFDRDMQGVIREKRENLATPASLDLGDYPHYMLKEIREVPQSVVNTCAVYSPCEKQVKAALDGVKRIILTGCGTAYNSGLVAKRYIEDFARIPAEAEIAGEFRYKNPIVDNSCAVICISQSGETADTVEAAALAKRLGGRVIAVTNAPYSALTRIADTVIPVAAGPEICVAATKSYTGQLAALYLLANTLSGRDISAAFARLKEVYPLLKCTIEHTGISAIADMCARSGGVYFLGRDLDYAVATEGSLKLKEISYIPSEGYPAGELKHGTLALIDERAAAVVLITSERLAAKSENAVEQVLSRGGKVAVITSVGGVAEKLEDRALVLEIPRCDEYLSPLITAVCVQRIAYETALILGRDPDKPRNLAKSVTVE